MQELVPLELLLLVQELVELKLFGGRGVGNADFAVIGGSGVGYVGFGVFDDRAIDSSGLGRWSHL